MIPQGLPGQDACPPRRPACPSRRSVRSPPRLWPNLPADTQRQVARVVAELIRRMQAAGGAAGRETARADALERP
jgi:hypothetical protein